MMCPICQKEIVKEFEPFCSQHCKNIDLLRWVNEDYRVPVVENEEKSEEEEGEL